MVVMVVVQMIGTMVVVAIGTVVMVQMIGTAVVVQMIGTMVKFFQTGKVAVAVAVTLLAKGEKKN